MALSKLPLVAPILRASLSLAPPIHTMPVADRGEHEENQNDFNQCHQIGRSSEKSGSSHSSSSISVSPLNFITGATYQLADLLAQFHRRPAVSDRQHAAR